ncbi:hypothetical protein SELMODRAFT_444493 [Selaginella moellendorffii]|uniref:Sodium/calcium exchanger membrane region domain-containing protein n=1 Tax=Selaginella moellendorffii TaxID=88036 RepID=D8SA39_SELML|nr:cation/calcium exchanger 4 [Selaginella moellendorffii]EFJ18533.1 hypothetical protein SELMODRAFT_444493 [Selaginella moellendorffii]|eukprot:XP_002980273.1 cation/calcium exchanger 4 [Selaginella moellendorffii]
MASSTLRLASLLLFLFYFWYPQLGIGSKFAHSPPRRRHLLQESASNPEIFPGNHSSLLFARSKFSVGKHDEDRAPCEGAAKHKGFSSPCSYAMAHEDCQSGGLFEYIQIYYCIDADNPHPRLKNILSFLAISLWLVALFYMLGNTAADYFCSCLERLSQLLRLPPTVAGVTLLPLGNGAADVFASVASFSGSHRGGAVGMNSVLGGAVFVVTVVTGVVNILVASGDFAIDGRCFVRDAVFFLASLGYLMIVLWKGSVSVWESLGYLGIYVIYALVVAVWEVWRARWESRRGDEECAGEYARLEGSKGASSIERVITVPPWLWANQVAIYSQEQQRIEEEEAEAVRSSSEEEKKMTRSKSLLKLGRKASQVLIEWPLHLPRRLTIPVVDESRWSRPRAVVAATLAPILLVAVWSAQNGMPITGDCPWLAAGMLVGIVLGVTAYFTTVDERPPQGHGTAALVWIAAGFFMSMVWFYVIARELVAALVSLAALLGIDAAILGVTVLAWGNSMGDLVANSALASRGGSAGVQIAIAGCYASPMFNTLFGLGVSFLIVAVRSHGAVYVIPGTEMAMLTLVFLAVAILMAIVGMTVHRMRPSKTLGVGLIVLYGAFMVVRACKSFGITLVW